MALPKHPSSICAFCLLTRLCLLTPHGMARTSLHCNLLCYGIITVCIAPFLWVSWIKWKMWITLTLMEKKRQTRFVIHFNKSGAQISTYYGNSNFMIRECSVNCIANLSVYILTPAHYTLMHSNTLTHNYQSEIGFYLYTRKKSIDANIWLGKCQVSPQTTREAPAPETLSKQMWPAVAAMKNYMAAIQAIM